MGLDMYLYGERYVSGYEFTPKPEQVTYAAVVKASGMGAVVDPETPHANVSVCVAYWRKANQIHNWFVEHVQDDVDECQRSHVTREQLTELLELCKQVLAGTKLEDGLVKNGETLDAETGEWVPVLQEGGMVVDTSVAEQLLPPASGFFFGSTDVDEWYVRDLKSTVEQLNRALTAPADVDFYYRSSW